MTEQPINETITMRQRIGNFISGMELAGPVEKELVGRYVMPGAQASVFKSRAKVKTVDETVPDYEFWDLLRRGKAVGFSLGGLFAKRIENIFASWVFGLGVEVKLKESATDLDNPNDPRNYTDKKLAEFVKGLLETPEDMGDDIDRESSLIFRLFEDMMGLGDQYVIVNSDGTLSVPSPETVEQMREEEDYRQMVGYSVETKLTGMTILDTYMASGRTVVYKRGVEIIRREYYSNLLGRIPVVHLSNGRSANETHGHSIHESMRPLYDQYDDLIYKQLDGAKLLGNPILAFVGMEDISAVINANDPDTQDTYTDKDGATATRTQLNIDQNAVLLVGKGGDAKFVAPPTGFSADTQQSLKTLFLLILDHTGIPEFIWGNELTSSRSSAEVQLTQFTRDIASRQRQVTGWLQKLCNIWLQTLALTDPKIVLEPLQVNWPELVTEDSETMLKVVQFAKDRGLLTARTALELLTLVDNPGIETSKAEAEADAAREKMYDDYPGRLSNDIDYQDENPDGSNV